MSAGEPADRLRAEVGRLTVLPASEFVAARGARSAELKAAGDTELARALTAQRRPTVPAWAADQLAHHHPDELERLFAAADALRAAQSAPEPDRAEVRAASRDFTAQVRHLRALAEERLEAVGTPPGAHLDEVEATLLAAAIDEEVATDLRAGALLRPAPSPGFTAFASSAPAAADRPDTPEDPGPPDDTRRSAEDTRRAAELASLRERRAEVAERHARAEDETRRAASRGDVARERLAQLRAEFERVERDLAEADAEVAAAREAERDARATADGLADEVAALDRRAEELAPTTT